MSDTVFAQDVMRTAFPKERHGSVKAAQIAARDFIRKHVDKDFTLRRSRSIWEGKARRIDGEEKDALRRAKIEEAKREHRELCERLSRLDAALACMDEEFHGPAREALRAQLRGSGLAREGQGGAVDSVRVVD